MNSNTAETAKKKQKKGRKGEFYLHSEDVNQFKFADLYYVSEIKEEMNRICTVEGVKKLTGVKILEYLASVDIITEEEWNGFQTKMPTKKGKELGIETIKKVSQAGNTYIQLRYPETIQKIVLEYFVGPREDGMPILK